MDRALTTLDATDQAGLVRRGEVTPRELVTAAIEAAERCDPALNAVIHRRFERALAEAGAAGTGAGVPFPGVPFLVKDAVCHTAGDPYHCGMRVLKELGWTERHDTWLAARFRRAGFVVIGRTNTPELATSVTTEPLAYGPTANPWDPGRSAGGSSGGSAAAVAAGIVPVAHGNDMGGSIRFPASMCGVVGLKPTRARTTLGPDFGEYWGPLTHEFVLTRSLRDTAAVLDAVAGMATGDPYTAPPPARPYAEEIGAPPGRLRVGFRTRRRDGTESHPECVAAVEATARLLEELGHSVEPAPIPALDTDDAAFGTVMTVAVARDVERWSRRTGVDVAARLEPLNAAIAALGRRITATQYVEAIEDLQSWSRRVSAWWDDHDVLVLPTSPEPPVPLGTLVGDDPAVAERMGGLVGFTVPWDATGQPALSLPLHHGAGGLPIGVQLVGAYGREDVLLRVGAQLEAARPWSGRLPPLHASRA
ncbi:MAG: 6-aminohexanoate-cyclic-dimer hydrolase [Acidimicrobiia bacterium]|nr:MAG: 6-aminohexanoate-cyclic-dimer hydrolase [Acidimicrobiia bacterium]